MTKSITLGGLLASLFPRSNRALSESLTTEDYNELGADVQEISNRLSATTPPAPEAVAAPEAVETEATQEVAELANEAPVVAETIETAHQAETAPEVVATEEQPEQEQVSAQELAQLRADAAAWQQHRAEYGVLQSWYANATKVEAGVQPEDAADLKPAKVKSWQTAPWNNR
jgi:hypothetical protein